jgi:hypothetical protein
MYEVGQVLYVVLNKKQQVVPVQVVEQVVRRSLEGEQVNYTVTVPNKSGLKDYALSDLDGNVYTSLEDVSETLTSNAKTMIEEMIEKTNKIAAAVFKEDDENEHLTNHDITAAASNNRSVKVELEGGVIANVRLPDID